MYYREKYKLSFSYPPNFILQNLSGGRVSASKVLIIVTDDKSSGKEPMKEAMKPLQDKGVRIYIVNIGTRPDEEETKHIVPDERNILTPKTTDEVPKLAPELAKKITDDTNDRKFGPCQAFSFRHQGFLYFFPTCSYQKNTSVFERKFSMVQD